MPTIHVIWLNWDGRAWIECNGVVVLKFGYGSADIFNGIEERRKAG